MQSQSLQPTTKKRRTPLWSSDKELKIQTNFLFAMMMARPSDLAAALAVVRKEDFDFNLQPVFDLVATQEAVSVDLISILERDHEGVLVKIFGSKADAIVASSEAYMSSQLHEKAFLIRQLAIKRLLIQKLQERVMHLEAGEDVFDAMTTVEQDVADLYPTDIRGGLIDMGTLINAEIDRASLSEDDKEKGYVKTGFHSVDSRIYGFMPGEFVFIGARPAMGKTGFGISLSINLVRQLIPHAFFSVEMTKEQIARRYLSQLSGIPVTTLAYQQLTGQNYKTIEDKYKSIIKLNSLTSLDDSSGATVEYIRKRTKQLVAERGVKMIIVDYLQKMSVTGDFGNREREIAHISGGLARIAKDCNIVVLAFGQLNREVEKRSDKRPTLADIRDSGSVEQDAHRVGFLFRPEVYGFETTDDGMNTAGMAELDWHKTRDGATGVCRLQFDDELTRFRDYVQPFQ